MSLEASVVFSPEGQSLSMHELVTNAQTKSRASFSQPLWHQQISAKTFPLNLALTRSV